MNSQKDARCFFRGFNIIYFVLFLLWGCSDEEMIQQNGEKNHSAPADNAAAAMAKQSPDVSENNYWFIDQIEDGHAAVMNAGGKIYWIQENALPAGAREGIYYSGDAQRGSDGPPNCSNNNCHLELSYTAAEAGRLALIRARLVGGDDGQSVIQI